MCVWPRPSTPPTSWPSAFAASSAGSRRGLRQAGSQSDLSPSQYEVFGTVARRGDLKLSDLAAIEGINPTLLSRVVAKLEADQLVTRTPDAEDRRVAHVVPTAKGRRRYEQIRECTHRCGRPRHRRADRCRAAPRWPPRSPCSSRSRRRFGTAARDHGRNRAAHVLGTCGSQLPPLLHRPGDLADRHLDADDGPGLARAPAHRVGNRPGIRRRPADAAGAAARARTADWWPTASTSAA